MPQAATLKSLPRAFRMMKAMQAQGIEWGEDYRFAAGAALKAVLEGRMAAAIDRHLAEMSELGKADLTTSHRPNSSNRSGQLMCYKHRSSLRATDRTRGSAQYG